MSAFSFTAPFISPEQEHEEFSLFPQEEKEAIWNDLYGKPESVDKDRPDSMSDCLALLQEALEAIPSDHKVEYLQALKRAPHLVRQESPGEAFLHAVRFDPWAAASRLASYWKFRKDIFGDNRAFLPMTLDGAMREDRRVFELGFCALLPPDKAGRQVIFWNRIACTRTVAHRDVFLRCLFYVSQVASEQQEAPLRGFVFLYNSRGFDLYQHFDRILMKKVAKLPNALPINFRSCHVITGSGQSVVSLILPIMKQLVGLRQRHRLKLHAGSDMEVLDRLGDYGIAPVSIPALFGGEWTAADFTKWLENRSKTEASRSLPSLSI